ncbi:MAG: Ni-sirohydrochlorin a,c-diamide reductive cyclase catalytic subunit [Methanobacterium sp.]|nr:Ni-sirohydrochlorin a,c-diamide reductive cyclase catalytic subunit [Methanobacterium sp.]
MHPRPSPIAASLYTLRDLNADVIILHGPHGCCFRTGRLLENDGVRVVTTAMSDNDFIFGASAKLEETLREADELFHPQLVGVVGTCASMIIGEDMREAVNNAGIPAKVLTVESHGGLSEGDNTEGAIAVLEAAQREGVIPPEEAERQSRMLKKATEIEKTRGMAQGKYIAPSYGDDKEEVASALLEVYPENKPLVIANLDLDTGLPRIRQHARNIQEELDEAGLEVDIITGGLDEYPMTGEKAVEYLQKENFDLIVVAGVPHALPIEKLDVQSIAITDGPRLVEPLKNLGYTWVVTELDAHAKTLGTDKIVESDFGTVLRGIIAEK